MGAFLFEHLEAESQMEHAVSRNNFQFSILQLDTFMFPLRLKTKYIDFLLQIKAAIFRENFTSEVWDITYYYNTLNEEAWINETNELLYKFQNDTVENIMKGYTGTDVGVKVWTFSSALMYSLTVFTTIGKSNNIYTNMF